ncbi:DNA repair protein RadA, partial [Aliarcobacter butzleri]|nr:DNA repair protein RadA [Aliarcobacter butzleri]
MAKKKISLFECQHCGEQSSKWLGKCPNCDSWDSFIELNQEQQEVLKQTIKVSNSTSKAKPITEILQDDVSRFSSFNYEFDLVLGGGIVPGSLTLIG